MRRVSPPVGPGEGPGAKPRRAGATGGAAAEGAAAHLAVATGGGGTPRPSRPLAPAEASRFRNTTSRRGDGGHRLKRRDQAAPAAPVRPRDPPRRLVPHDRFRCTGAALVQPKLIARRQDRHRSEGGGTPASRRPPEDSEPRQKGWNHSRHRQRLPVKPYFQLYCAAVIDRFHRESPSQICESRSQRSTGGVLGAAARCG